MIHVQIDNEALKALYLERVNEHLKEIEETVFFMNSKQLQKYLNMSWSSIETYFLHDPEFGSIRLGSRWLHHKRQVDSYMERYYQEVKQNGGDITAYKRKGG